MRSETSTIFKTLISSNYVMVGALEVYTCHHNAAMAFLFLMNTTVFTVFQMPNAVSYRNTFYWISTVSLHDLSLLLAG